MDSTSDRDTFVAADLGWFDPFYTEKPAETGEHIEQEGSKNIYHDVFSITERLKDVARTNSKVKETLQICLRGEALPWHANELTELEKSLLRESIDARVEALITRFKPPMEDGLRILAQEECTLKNASRHREPREYGQARLRAAKIAGIEKNQRYAACHYADVDGPRHFFPSHARSEAFCYDYR